jgi:hypothetical protein
MLAAAPAGARRKAAGETARTDDGMPLAWDDAGDLRHTRAADEGRDLRDARDREDDAGPGAVGPIQVAAARHAGQRPDLPGLSGVGADDVGETSKRRRSATAITEASVMLSGRPQYGSCQFGHPRAVADRLLGRRAVAFN